MRFVVDYSVYKCRKPVFGADSLMAGYITQNIATLHHIIRNVKKARLMYAQAESILDKHLGPEHEDVLQCHEQAQRLDTLDTISLLKIPDVNQKIIA